MNAFFYDSWAVILKFLIPGILLGAIYDLFRFFRIARNDHTYNLKQAIQNRFSSKNDSDVKKRTQKQFSESTILFVEDILFFIIVAITEILAFFHLNNGEIRICYLVVSVVGFFVYQNTIGNLIIFFSKKTLYIIRNVLYFVSCVILIPSIFFFKIFKKLFRKRYPKSRKSQSNND